MKKPRKRILYRLLSKGLWEVLKRLYRRSSVIVYNVPLQCEIEAFLSEHNRMLTLLLLKGYQLYLEQLSIQKDGGCKVYVVNYRLVLLVPQKGQKPRLTYYLYGSLGTSNTH